MSPVLAVGIPQGGELIVILVIVILLFGAKKLPELGSSVGKSIRNFKSGIDEGKREDDAPAATSDARPSASAARDTE
ncbi:MAG TPA: twin-arginine translocase TatA/TatE family subunit [Egibacteraceae bacterium]|nr:twin-arginine translocase TatA/TatE family subunit [Egibacteraceae bacterium]